MIKTNIYFYKRVLSLFFSIGLFSFILIAISMSAFAAENPLVKTNPDTICNPINISYQYQYNFNARESADPEMIFYKGDYFLFASHGSGYWYTKDLVKWNYVKVTTGASGIEQEWQRFAPGVCVIGDTVYIAMSDGGQIIKSDNPYDGNSWSIVGRPISNCYDPCLLVDDDSRVYCYYGNAGVGGFLPLSVQELDPKNNMARIGTAKTNIIPTDRNHGFEVVGDDNRNFTASVYNEGLYCTKYNGKYYLQYATPGTQFVSYANGCYVSDNPMGPFTFCKNSPISYKSTGFMTGAGHGSLIQDERGNWWKIDTVSISQSHNFERRLNIFPAKFNQYDQLVTNTTYADYPMYKMTYEHDNFSERPAWNLISYGAAVTASSSLEAANRQPSYAFNENIRDWWSAATGDAGEWIQADLKKVCDVSAIQINFADQDVIPATRYTERDNAYCYRYLVEFSEDGINWFTVVDKSNATAQPNMAQDTSHDYYELVSGVKARYVRLTNKGPVPAEGKFAVSGLRLFGNGGSVTPVEVKNIKVDRALSDQRSINISWDAAEGAEGYIIRFGNKSDSRHLQYKVIGETSASFNILNVGVDYYFSVDSYNDSGITAGTTIVMNKPDIAPDDQLVIVADSVPDENSTVFNPKFSLCAKVPMSANLILAAYDTNGKLLNATIANVSLEADIAATLQASIPCQEHAAAYKFFIWDAGYKPLTAITSISDLTLP